MICTVTQTTFTTEYQYSGTTAKVRIYHTKRYVGSLGEIVIAAQVGGEGWFDEIDCTIVNGHLVVPTFDLIVTVNGTPPTSRFFGVLYSQDGVRRETIFGGSRGWVVPAEVSVSTQTLEILNRAVAIFEPLREYLVATEVLRLIGTIKLDDLSAPDDNTDLDASPSAHGLLPKLPNNAAQFLNGQGAFTTPGGGGDVSGPAASVASELALFDGVTGKLLKRATQNGVIIATSGIIGAAALSGNATDFLNGTGAFSVPAGGGGGATFPDTDILATAW